MAKSLRVQLPVCPVPECRKVGKQPGRPAVTYICTGGEGSLHKRTKMELREFREVGA